MSDGKKLRIDTAEAHTVESVLADALQIIGAEIAKLKPGSRSLGQMDPLEAKVLSSFVDLTIKLSREQREAALGHRVEELSDDKLDLLLQEATRHLTKRQA